MAKRPLALVTGASGGIGADLARELALDGHDLVLVARTAAALEKLAGELTGLGATASVEAVDLIAPGAVAALMARLNGRGVEIDVLVNNAGFGDALPFVEGEPGKLTDIITLNMTVLTQLMRAVLPEMKARRAGRILNVASTAAFQPGPGMAVYCATKAYVLSLSEAVDFELRGSGVRVQAICPGPTHTGFAKAAKAENNALFKGGFNLVMQPAQVAEIGYRGFKRGKRVAITGVINTVMARLSPFTPRFILLPITNALLGGH